MNSETIILREYNLNIININYILNNKIELEISNFIYSNNLSLSIKSIDTKKIVLHYLIQGILNYSKLDYSNIILQKNNYSSNHINFLADEKNCTDYVKKLLQLISKKMDIPLVYINREDTIDKDFIYKLKLATNNKSKNTIQKMTKFLQKNNLKKLFNDTKTDPTLKLRLHKI